MNSLSPEQLAELRHRTIERIDRINARLTDVERHLSKELRHQAMPFLGRGISAVNHSVRLWARRQVI